MESGYSNIIPIKQPILTADEIAVIRDFRGLVPECKLCLRALIGAAKEYRDGKHLDFLAHMIKSN